MNNPITIKQAAYIKRNMNKVTFHNMRSALKISSEVMYEWLKNVHRPDKLIVIDEDQKELHSNYLVSLNQFNYMVNFNVPIDYDTIQYCTDQIGYDYEVCKLSLWEYNHLRNHIPCINIKTDAHYVANFWSTTQLWRE